MSTSTCKVCNKPLSDPFSREQGIGPVCRMNAKNEEGKSRMGNVFGMRSNYEFFMYRDVMVIRDLDGDVSVTNDIEQVLTDLRNNVQFKPDTHHLIYRDSMGYYDRILLNPDRTLKQFKTLGGILNLNEATTTVKRIKLS